MTNHLHVTTGGPGSGKTSLIEALAGGGVRHMPEADRSIIQDQVDIGGTALPWDDREAFATLMLTWEMRSYREALIASGPAIFEQDTERKQALAEAEATYHAMEDAYSGLGYELVSLPLAPVVDRVRFVREIIG